MKDESSEVEWLLVGRDRDGNVRFGELLAAARQRAGMTTTQAAEIAQVSRAYVRMIERGERAPAAATAKTLLDAYGASTEVEPLMGDWRPDLRVDFQWTSTPVVVEFKNRIREQRSTSAEGALSSLLQTIATFRQAIGGLDPDQVRSVVDLGDPNSASPLPTDRDSLVGRIVTRLGVAPMDVLRQVDQLLTVPGPDDLLDN